MSNKLSRVWLFNSTCNIIFTMNLFLLSVWHDRSFPLMVINLKFNKKIKMVKLEPHVLLVLLKGLLLHCHQKGIKATRKDGVSTSHSIHLTKQNIWKWKWKSLSHVQLFAMPWTVACQAPLSMEFFRKELLEWVATSFSKGIFPSQKIEGNLQVSLNAGRLFTVWASRKAQTKYIEQLYIKRLWMAEKKTGWLRIHELREQCGNEFFGLVWFLSLIYLALDTTAGYNPATQRGKEI